MKKVQIIAEIGQHWVRENIGKWIIRLAKENGADFAKFQLFDSVKLYGEYKKTELPKKMAEKFFKYGQEIGIEVFFSVFDVERVQWCEEMGVKRYKIAYSQSNNSQLINAVLATKKPHLVSSQMPSCLYQNLYCIPKYPTNHEDLVLSEHTFSDMLWQGFSDHTIGLTAAKVAISRGAQIIEKHFCLNHYTGVDAKWSMTPSELKELRTFADEAVQCL